MRLSKIDKVLAALRAERDELDRKRAVLDYAIAKVEAELVVRPKVVRGGKVRVTTGTTAPMPT